MFRVQNSMSPQMQKQVPLFSELRFEPCPASKELSAQDVSSELAFTRKNIVRN